MEMKSEVGVCSEEEVGVGEGEGQRVRTRFRGATERRSKGRWGYMRQSRCDRVDATESMEWRSRHRVSAVTRT